MTEHDTLAKALLAFQADPPKLVKGSTAKAGSFSYKYIDLGALMEAVGPKLAEHGLVWSTFPCLTPNGEPGLRYKLTHAPSGDCESEVMPLMVTKPDAQGLGSAISYMRRYSLTSVLNLVADDDDGQAATQQPRQRPQQPPQRDPGLISGADIAAIEKACEGLTKKQVVGAFRAHGLDATKPFGQIPRIKVVELVRHLSGLREAA